MLVPGPITNHILGLIRDGHVSDAAEVIAGMSDATREDFLVWTMNNCSRETYYMLKFHIDDRRPLC